MKKAKFEITRPLDQELIYIKFEKLSRIDLLKIFKFNEIINTHLNDFNSKGTTQVYKRDLEQFIFDLLKFKNGISITHPKEITRKHVSEFKKDLKEQGYKNVTINRKLSGLSSIFKVLVEENLMYENPASKVCRMKNTKLKMDPSKTSFTNEEIKIIAYSFDENNTRELMFKTLILFLAYTGARVSETISLKVSDFKLWTI